MADLQALAEAVISGNKSQAESLTQAAIDEGVKPGQIINEALIAGMSVVGEKFKNNEFYVPEVLIAARAMQSAMALVKPLVGEGEIQARGKVAIGTVKGDLHDIGKNLVAMMLEGGGYDVVDLTVDVSPEQFVGAVNEQGCNAVALSALLTTTMPSMKDTIDALSEAGVRGKVKVIIGGAPVTQSYADEIGADGYAPDAASAVDKLSELLA
ncbi:MAG TPA: corrinoid protein [Armatimonadota bacterium]|nr:corrinoid protein [Armatimonadota bacterium]